MKKSVAIVFLTLYLLGTTQLGELLKFPILIEHFIEHKEKNPEMSFWNYLCEHYSDYNHTDKDYEKDMQLPFKTMSHNSSDVVLHFDDVFESEAISKICFIEKKQSLVYSGFIYVSTYLSAIWQPPKVC